MNAFLLILLLAFDPTELHGRVVSVTDGDTVKILVDREQVTVRLAGIDAPEKGQPFGKVSREALAGLVFEKDVVVEVTGKDGFGRTLGTVYVGKANVNEEMIRTGFAWRYAKYSKSPKMIELESAARTAKLGLWSDPSPIPPWEWRRGKRATSGPQ